MAETGRVWAESLIATNSLNAYQFLAVYGNADNACDLASGTSIAVRDGFLGILQNKPRAGEFAEVQVSGFSKYIAGAAVTAGQDLKVSNGYLIATAPASGQTEYSVGQAIYGVASGATGLMKIDPAWRPSFTGS